MRKNSILKSFQKVTGISFVSREMLPGRWLRSNEGFFERAKKCTNHCRLLDVMLRMGTDLEIIHQYCLCKTLADPGEGRFGGPSVQFKSSVMNFQNPISNFSRKKFSLALLCITIFIHNFSSQEIHFSTISLYI